MMISGEWSQLMQTRSVLINLSAGSKWAKRLPHGLLFSPAVGINHKGCVRRQNRVVGDQGEDGAKVVSRQFVVAFRREHSTARRFASTHPAARVRRKPGHI